ncbi:MAG: glucose-6-phosphate dehydrogenase assembly protein OpcA [Pyrinomonadaceae bacterium]
MEEARQTEPQHVPVPATLDVQAVERELSELWKRNAGASRSDEEGAVMRARVLNLMVYVSLEQALTEVDKTLAELTTTHPCRALVMLAELEAEDKDIEMFVSSFCHAEGRKGAGEPLCGEEIGLAARGRFTVELPSAVVPLLVPDLPIFLWWRDVPRFGDKVFSRLSRASDRVVIDSVSFGKPYEDMRALAEHFQTEDKRHGALTDLNWSRLTSWRALLACFYDVPDYRPALERIVSVKIEYVAPDAAPREIAPQALMIAGWLASRLNWTISQEQTRAEDGSDARAVSLEHDGRRIVLEFKRVERPEMKQGRLALVELRTEAEEMCAFAVRRSDDGLYLETRATRGADVRAGRVLKVRNRSEAVLLGRELEIISHDVVYEQAVATAVKLLDALSEMAGGDQKE